MTFSDFNFGLNFPHSANSTEEQPNDRFNLGMSALYLTANFETVVSLLVIYIYALIILVGIFFLLFLFFCFLVRIFILFLVDAQKGSTAQFSFLFPHWKHGRGVMTQTGLYLCHQSCLASSSSHPR